VVKTWLRRFLGLGDSSSPAAETKSGLQERLDKIDERLDFHAGMIRRLRGRITGGLRGDPESPEAGSDTGEHSGAVRGNPQAIELLKKRGRM